MLAQIQMICSNIKFITNNILGITYDQQKNYLQNQSSIFMLNIKQLLQKLMQTDEINYIQRPKISTKQNKAEKIIYKSQKRKVRNRLIYLVGFHILFIFIFAGLLCVEYLIPRTWDNIQYISGAADLIFSIYIIEALVAIKFKHRKILIISIVTLALAISTKTVTLLLLLQADNETAFIVLAHLILFVMNAGIPLGLLLLWNKLRQDKWRATFDLEAKLKSHLINHQDLSPSLNEIKK